VAELSDEDVVKRFDGHPVTRDSAAFYRGWLEHELRMNRCGDCGTWHHPPRPICPQCWSTNVQPTPVRGAGTIHLLVLLYQGPSADGVDYRTPHPVVTVELDEQPGLRFTSTVVGSDNDDIAIGERVALGWVERAGLPYPVFRLARAAVGP